MTSNKNNQCSKELLTTAMCHKGFNGIENKEQRPWLAVGNPSPEPKICNIFYYSVGRWSWLCTVALVQT